MSEELRFDDRVVIVTGAGQGLGRAHALLLASRGARVVVNDLGGTTKGSGSSEDPAESVVAEIRDAGGEAVADFNSVASQEGGEAIVKAAVDAFGKVDAVIHNAGVSGGKGVDDFDVAILDRTLDVHLRGAFFVLTPAWKLMKDQGYGRILNTISNAGIFGLPNAQEYAAAKGGLAAFTRSLAAKGEEFGIKANALCPAAKTRMANADFGPLNDWWLKWFQPERVSPVAAWLIHEECPVTGEIYSAGGGRVGRIFLAETQGIWSETLSIEEMRDRFDEIRDEANYEQPTQSADEILKLYVPQIPQPEKE